MKLSNWVGSVSAFAKLAILPLVRSQFCGEEGGNVLGEPLPSFLEGPLSHGYPWGLKTCNNSNPTDPPNTGVTRYYDFVLARGTRAPDGVPVKNLILVNGQYPGPLIEANWGDWIEVRVTNAFDEGTTVHWHGFLQRDTQFYDGVPGISQCPIAPNTTSTYRFQASQYGTTWWHSHLSAQLVGAVQGPLVVHGPQCTDYDIDLGPVMLSDWFHIDYYSIIKNLYLTVPAGVSNIRFTDNIMINGRADYNCSQINTTCTANAGISKFQFQTGKKHLLRLINSGANAQQKFSIDGHKLTVVAVDFTDIVPYTTDVVTLVTGQRTDIVVEGVGSANSSYLMRSDTSPICSNNNGLYMSGYAGVYYEGADVSVRPNTTSTVSHAVIMT